MSAGIKYDLTPQEVEKELCRVETIHRLAGGFNLDDDKLAAGSYLPVLAPLAIDFATRKAKAVKNVKVYENAAANALAIKVAKNSLSYVGMFVGNGTKAAEVTAIDKTNAAYDALTVTLGAAVTAGDILFEVAAASTDGTKGVSVLTIGTKPAAEDKFSLDGVVYEFAAAETDVLFAVQADAKAAAAVVEDAISAQYQGVFTVKALNGKLTFTQVVPGVGAVPVLVVTKKADTGTIVAAIAETTPGVAAVSVSAPKNVANFLNYARVKVEAGATVTAIGQAFEIKESKLTVPVSANDKLSLTSRFMFV